MPAESAPVTIPSFRAWKASKRRITMLTAYDYLWAELFDSAGVDCLLVGDSMGNVVHGKATTLGVTLDQIIYHTEMVSRAARRALVIADLPFGTFQLGRDAALQAAVRIMKETTAQAVKLESGIDQADTISALVRAGIPVMGHCGLRPQSVHTLGGFKVQRDRAALLAEATAAEQAGAFAIVVECIPSELAAELTRTLTIPTIGIGAGLECDGQVLVSPDMLGITDGPGAKFVKRFADLRGQAQAAVREYCTAVRDQKYPGPEHSYK